MNTIFSFLLIINRFYMIPIRIIVLIAFILFAIIMMIKRKNILYSILMIFFVLTLLLADYFGSEGAIISFNDCLSDNISSILLVFLCISYGYLLLSGFILSIVSLLICNNKNKRMFVLITILISTIVVYLSCIFYHDIGYSMGEVYETSNALVVIIPLLLRYLYVPIIGITIFLILFFIYKKKKTN